jgi:polysaccharide export outer membrane protein
MLDASIAMETAISLWCLKLIRRLTMRYVTLVLAALSCFTAWPAMAQDFRVSPGDGLEISVLEDPALNRTVLVRPDGRISMPLAGTIDVGGRTPEEIQSIIRQRLSRDFVTPPEVTVSLVRLGEQSTDEELDELASIYVIGAVAAPGLYQVPLPVDALQLLAQAGGPGTFAARQRIQIRRRNPEAGESLIVLDYEAIERGAVPSTVITLQDGDVIVVPERRLFE